MKKKNKDERAKLKKIYIFIEKDASVSEYCSGNLRCRITNDRKFLKYQFKFVTHIKYTEN